MPYMYALNVCLIYTSVVGHGDHGCTHQHPEVWIFVCWQLQKQKQAAEPGKTRRSGARGEREERSQRSAAHGVRQGVNWVGGEDNRDVKDVVGGLPRCVQDACSYVCLVQRALVHRETHE